MTSDAQDPDALSTERLRLWLRTLRAVRSVEGRLRERLRAEFGTTLPRFDVMATLYAAPEGLRMSELSRLLVVSNGNVTGVVDRLVAEGLLHRCAVEGDRRAVRIRLTPAGLALAEAMIAAHRGWIDAALAAVDRDAAAEAGRVMRAIRHGRDGAGR